MKLYSRAQVIFFSVVSSLIVFLLFIGFGFQNLFVNETKDISAEPVKREDPFIYQTSTPTDNEFLQVNNNNNSYTEDELQNISIYEKLNEAVVNITVETVTLNWFLEPVPRQGGSGSGSIIDKRGYVLTNKHVVENAYKVYIRLYNGEQYEGDVVGVDPENDLAVIKFDPENKDLITIPFGDSSILKVGQKVLAIGNPFGYDRTLTTGVVSGLGRPVKESSDSPFILREMIQTDASINPGNSGGPLIDSSGKMIAINTMIYSPSGGSVGIGFAVPVNTARRIVPDLIKYGKVRRGWIDIEPIQLFPELVRYAKLPVSKGLLVSTVDKKGNAKEAGIMGGRTPVRYGRSTFYIGGDVIVEIDGTPVSTYSDFYSALEDNKPGEVVNVIVIRNGKRKVFSVKLSERS